MIPVQNIYYMLSYAFQALQAQNYKDLATENFHNTAELCAAILDKGISIQLKRGLGRDYVPKSESLSTLQGKLNISESIKTQTLLKKQMICTYDEFSTNTQFNQIIKSTMLLLLKANITNTRKKSLRNLLLFFSDVNENALLLFISLIKQRITSYINPSKFATIKTIVALHNAQYSLSASSNPCAMLINVFTSSHLTSKLSIKSDANVLIVSIPLSSFQYVAKFLTCQWYFH